MTVSAATASDDHRWMERALELARAAEDAGEVPVGAVLVRGGEVLAEAHNAPRGRCDLTAHAEMLVLQRACTAAGAPRLPGTTLYVTLEPCFMCAGALVHARIDRLVYGAADPKSGACGGVFDLLGLPCHNHHPAVTGGVLAEPCGSLLRAFFRSRRKSCP